MLIVLIVAFVMLVFANLKNSRLGRAWIAIREDEDAARAMGIRTGPIKILAFLIGATLAGFAGAFFAHKTATVSYESFRFLESVTLLAAVILGGMGTIPGAVLGASILFVLPEKLREFADYRLLLFGIALILIMRFRPQGIVPDAHRRAELAEERGATSPCTTPTIRTGGPRRARRRWSRDRAGHCGGAGGQRRHDAVRRPARARRRVVRAGRGRDHRADRAERRRQDHAVQLPDRPLRAHVGHGVVARQGSCRRTRRGSPRQGVARTFQNIRLFPSMTAAGERAGRAARADEAEPAVVAAARPGLPQQRGRGARSARAELLEFVGLTRFADELARNLPYGDQRRLEIARALATDPAVLLLDEPTAGMNAQETEATRQLIFTIRELGISVVVIEHDTKFIFTLCDRVLVLVQGELLVEGTPGRGARRPAGRRGLPRRAARRGRGPAPRGASTGRHHAEDQP